MVQWPYRARARQTVPARRRFHEQQDGHNSPLRLRRRRQPHPSRRGAGRGRRAPKADHDHPRLVDGFRALQAAEPHHTFRVIEGANHTFGAVHPFSGSTPHLDEALRMTVDFLRRALA
ncbi:hypothetical protein [Calditerricola satsumensis]|uniref:hypothetical protein n=1 Tax=Calditerricola satsumensis TaxID=373054 RepID=UPI001E4AB137|nr:hypothetical protein [Calditerricola satsumensis]